MIIGAQLFTIRQFTQTERDFARSMEKISAIGYKTVQLSAVGNIPAKNLRQICDANGLKIVLTHTPPERLLASPEEVIEEHNILGCRYIGIGMMPERYLYEGWLARFAQDFVPVGRKLAAAGKLLMYHNHSLEFSSMNGRLIMDMLKDDFSPDHLGFTLDTYWVQHAGASVCEWIDKLAGRLPCAHLKDMAVILENGAARVVMAPVMEGNMAFGPMLEALKKAGTEYLLVEQDICREDPFACLKKSYDNLAALGYR